MGEHAGFLIAGYGATWVVLLWYAWRLRKRSAEARQDVERVAEGRERGEHTGV